jgi:hypothetical protein
MPKMLVIGGFYHTENLEVFAHCDLVLSRLGCAFFPGSGPDPDLSVSKNSHRKRQGTGPVRNPGNATQ